MERYVFLAALAATLIAGCASTNNSKSATDEDDKTYVTGSRIPVKDAVHGSVSSTTDRAAIQDMVRPPRTSGSGIAN